MIRSFNIIIVFRIRVFSFGNLINSNYHSIVVIVLVVDQLFDSYYYYYCSRFRWTSNCSLVHRKDPFRGII